MPRKTKSTDGEDLAKRVGRNIKAFRARSGLTQGELAEAIGIEPVTMSRVETGAQLPSLDRLSEIARVLKTSLAALVSDDEKGLEIAAMLADELASLPPRERAFIHRFVVDYAQHYRSGKKR